MIDKAQRKLREARFFYRFLLEGKSVNEPEAFQFYFSAFITAARSVAFAIKKEEKEKWNAWKPEWDNHLTIDQRKLERLTNQLRIDEKLGGSDVSVEWEEIAFNEMLGLHEALGHDSRHPAYGMRSSASPGAKPVKLFRQTYYVNDEDGRAEVIGVCRDYLKHLEKLVRDFLSAHS